MITTKESADKRVVARHNPNNRIAQPSIKQSKSTNRMELEEAIRELEHKKGYKFTKKELFDWIHRQ